MEETNKQFEEILSSCRTLFSQKLHDYGAAWRIMRIPSVTDQLLIKAERIRSLETNGNAMIDEGIESEYTGIVNYGIIGLIQFHLHPTLREDLTEEQALAYYDQYAKETYELMVKKNHDYDEAWRGMRISSYTDLILMKIWRTKQIEDLSGKTLVSEGIDANYMDMINYAMFALIKIRFAD